MLVRWAGRERGEREREKALAVWGTGRKGPS